MRRPRIFAGPLAAALALALAAAGCSSGGGSGGGSGGSGGPSAGTATPQAASTGPATTPPVASAGCAHPSTAAAVSTQRQTLTSGGVQRWWLLSAPADSRTPKPLVVDFHGLSEGATAQAAVTRFGALGRKDGFVVVEPNGTKTPVQWNITPNATTNTDLVFVASMLDTVERARCIDSSRVYATGLSMGAFMSSLVACTMADRFAAVAPVAGVQVEKPCDTGRPVPILAIHGTADPILHFNGGVDLSRLSGRGPKPSLPPTNLNGPGYPAAVRQWAAKDGCAATPATTRVSPHVQLLDYHCPAGTAVEFYVVSGGGHAWPGSTLSAAIAAIVGPTTMEIDATPLIWQFFQRFALPRA